MCPHPGTTFKYNDKCIWYYHYLKVQVQLQNTTIHCEDVCKHIFHPWVGLKNTRTFQEDFKDQYNFYWFNSCRNIGNLAHFRYNGGTYDPVTGYKIMCHSVQQWILVVFTLSNGYKCKCFCLQVLAFIKFSKGVKFMSDLARLYFCIFFNLVFLHSLH